MKVIQISTVWNRREEEQTNGVKGKRLKKAERQPKRKLEAGECERGGGGRR